MEKYWVEFKRINGGRVMPFAVDARKIDNFYKTGDDSTTVSLEYGANGEMEIAVAEAYEEVKYKVFAALSTKEKK